MGPEKSRIQGYCAVASGLLFLSKLANWTGAAGARIIRWKGFGSTTQLAAWLQLLRELSQSGGATPEHQCTALGPDMLVQGRFSKP